MSALYTRKPCCSNCGWVIKKWAVAQGMIGPALISMLMCRNKACNETTAQEIKKMLRRYLA